MGEIDTMEGRVLWFGGTHRDTGKPKNFGFVRLTDGRELFVHKNELLDSTEKRLEPNDVIRCRVGTDRVSGKPCALDVELVSRAAA